MLDKGEEIMECIFCKIVQGEVPCTVVYEDKYVIGFEDIYPSATNHIIVIPKIHVEDLNNIGDENIDYIKYIFNAVTKIVKKLEIDGSGYRVVNNCGENAFQSVKHLHFHIVGGQELTPTFC